MWCNNGLKLIQCDFSGKWNILKFTVVIIFIQMNFLLPHCELFNSLFTLSLIPHKILSFRAVLIISHRNFHKFILQLHDNCNKKFLSELLSSIWNNLITFRVVIPLTWVNQALVKDLLKGDLYGDIERMFWDDRAFSRGFGRCASFGLIIDKKKKGWN